MVLYQNLTHEFDQGSTHHLVQVPTDSGAWISGPDFLMNTNQKRPLLLKVAGHRPELVQIDSKESDSLGKVAGISEAVIYVGNFDSLPDACRRKNDRTDSEMGLKVRSVLWSYL